jgi:tetratricopeptide (TPR) repeat protein
MHEVDNIRVAWATAVESENFSSLGSALRSFTLLHLISGWLQQGIDQLELVMLALRARSGDQEEWPLLGQVLAQQGMLFFRLGQFGQAQDRYRESLAILRPIGDPGLLSDPLINHGTILHLTGEIDRAQSVLNEGLACVRETGDPWYTAYVLYNLGYVASLLGRYAEGYEQMLGGLAMWRGLGDLHYIALGLNFISQTACHLGRYEEAQGFLHESLALSAQLGDRWGMGTAYRNLGSVALAQGNISEAEALLHKSLDVFSGVVGGWDIVLALIYLGEASAAAGDSLQARRFFLNALHGAVEAQTTLLAMDALTGLAYVQASTGQAEQALQLSVYVLCHSASTQQAKDRVLRLRLQLEPQLTPEQVETAQVWAQAKSLETLVAEILDVLAEAQPRQDES